MKKEIFAISMLTTALLCQSCHADENSRGYLGSAVNYVANLHHVSDDTNQIVSDDTIIDTTYTAQSTADSQPNDYVHIVAVGDVMIGSHFPNVGFLPADDAKNSFSAVKPYLVGDVVFGNLEGTLTESNTSPKCQTAPTTPTDESTDTPTPKPCYAFAMPTRYGAILKDAGFNLMSIANNHISDFGDEGRISTKNTLSDAGIYYAGLLTKPTTIFTKNNVKYGMVAVAPNIGTVNLNDLETVKKYVKELDKKVDIVIVSFHGGAEGEEYTRVPKTTEMFLGENRGDVYTFAHAVIDAGADIVIGHGPHVARAVEVYKDHFIAYSLGNFNTYGAFSLNGAKGIAPLLNITLTKDGKFVSADVISVYQTKDKGLRLDPQHRAYETLKKLTALDFPNNVTFTNGKITH